MSEEMTFPQIKVERELGRPRVSFLAEESGAEYIQLPLAVWNYGAIVSALIRRKYSEDDVEAIMSNSLLLLSSADTVSENEATEKQTELNTFQSYREECKARAKALLALNDTFGLTEMNG